MQSHRPIDAPTIRAWKTLFWTKQKPDPPHPPAVREVLGYVKRLIQLRTLHPAVSVNKTNFLHVDFDGGKSVVVGQRGPAENSVTESGLSPPAFGPAV